jgi:6,7-dimethyl-8-ribityllumazine synthase
MKEPLITAETYEGYLDASGLKFAVLVSRFNHFITDKLLEGALDAFYRHNAKSKDIKIYKVPGTFEIPMIAKTLAKMQKFDAIVCLGAVLRGSTPHFEYIAAEAIKGIALASLETGVPIILGIITADTLEQAIERAGTKGGNKGFESAMAAVEMANLLKLIKNEGAKT